MSIDESFLFSCDGASFYQDIKHTTHTHTEREKERKREHARIAVLVVISNTHHVLFRGAFFGFTDDDDVDEARENNQQQQQRKRKRKRKNRHLPRQRINVIAQLVDTDGNTAGPQLDLPHDCTSKQLEELLNTLLNNTEEKGEKLPYEFYIKDETLTTDLGDHLEKVSEHGTGVENRVRPTGVVSSETGDSMFVRDTRSRGSYIIGIVFSGRETFSERVGDTTVRLWNHESEAPKTTCKGHTNWVLCVAWSPDAQLVASGGMDNMVRLWDPVTGESKGILKGHKKHIVGLSWEPTHALKSPNDVRFVSASADGTAKVWNVNKKIPLFSLSAHSRALSSVKWGGEGLIYTASRDTTVYAWDAKGGKIVRQLKGHAHWVNTLALSSEFALRTGAFDETGKREESFEKAKERALERYKKLTRNKPERLISGSDDFTMFLWEPSLSKTALKRLTGHVQLINHVMFSPDGKYFASASFDKAVKLWNGDTGDFVCTFRGHVGAVYQIAWSADSRFVLSASKDSTLKVWSVRLKKLELDLPGHSDEIYACDWSPLGTKGASGGKDKMLRLWKH